MWQKKVLAPKFIDVLSNPYYIPFTFEYQEKSTTKDKSKTDTKATTIVPSAPNVFQNKPCTTAKISGGDVVRGNRLTIDEYVRHVQLGGNVMCDNQPSAYMVAKRFPSHTIPEIDKNQKPGNKYYYHYHPDRYSHRHIWFY